MTQNHPTNWRELCKEILQLLDYYIPQDDRPTCWDPWRERVRLALTQSEPEVVGPTDAELEALADQFWVENSVNFEAEHYAFARAVLARWGRPAPAAERGGGAV